MSRRRFEKGLRSLLAAAAAGGFAFWLSPGTVHAGEVVVAIDAGHGGNRLTLFVAFEHKAGINQIINLKLILAHQPT